MQYVLVGLVVLAIAWFVTTPLRRPREQGDERVRLEARVEELELRKESKYREIRDAQLDHAAGKIDDADFGRLDAELRHEAVVILRELDAAMATLRRQ